MAKFLAVLVAGVMVSAVALALIFGWCYLVGWLAVAVAAGFGTTLPFWPTVGGASCW